MSRKTNELTSTLRDEGIDAAHKYDNKRKSRRIYLTNIEKISSYRSDHESDKKYSETNVFNFVNSENTDKELKSESIEKNIKDPKAKQNDVMENNKVINIHLIANRIHEHSDIWKCKTWITREINGIF